MTSKLHLDRCKSEGANQDTISKTGCTLYKTIHERGKKVKVNSVSAREQRAEAQREIGLGIWTGAAGGILTPRFRTPQRKVRPKRDLSNAEQLRKRLSARKPLRKSSLNLAHSLRRSLEAEENILDQDKRLPQLVLSHHEGGANRMMLSCVGFASTPLRPSSMQICQAETTLENAPSHSTAFKSP